MSTFEQNGAPLPDSSAWRRFNLYDPPAAPASLYDMRTQSEVLARLIMEPNLLQEPFGDLTANDFGGSVHRSLFCTIAKLTEEGKPFDVPELAEAWAAEKQVADPIFYLSDLLNTEGLDLARNLRGRVEKLHKLTALRRVLDVSEKLRRHAESPQTDPYALIETLGLTVEGLRNGYYIDGQLVPHPTRNLARRPDLITLSSVEAQPVPWLWRPYLSYESLNLLSGEPGVGKTYLALSFAAALTVGKIPFSGEPIAPMNVVYLSIENSPKFVVRPRFDALRGDADRFHLLQGAVTGEGPQSRRESVRLSDIALLDETVKRTKAKLIVVDPIQSFLGREVDMHRSNETRPVLDGLILLAERHKACLMICRHFAKATTGSAINRGLGSIDFTAAARSEMHAGLRDKQRTMAHAKNNVGPFGKSLGYDIRDDGSDAGEFLWTGEVSTTASDLAANGMADEERDAVGEAVEALTEMLRGGPKLKSDIVTEMREIGVSNATLRRAKMKLGVQSRKRSGARDGHFEWVLEGYEDGQIAAS